MNFLVILAIVWAIAAHYSAKEFNKMLKDRDNF